MGRCSVKLTLATRIQHGDDMGPGSYLGVISEKSNPDGHKSVMTSLAAIMDVAQAALPTEYK